MTRSTAYAHQIVITAEEQYRVSVEFQLPERLTEDEQRERAEQILLAVRDNLETGTADMEVQPCKVVETETTTWVASA